MDGLITVQHLDQDLFVIEGRAGAIGPLVRKSAIIFLQVLSPKLFPRKIKRGYFTVPVKKEGHVAVGYGRGRGEIAFIIIVVAGSYFLVPKDFAAFALETNRPHPFALLVGGTEEDPLFPDDGGGRR